MVCEGTFRFSFRECYLISFLTAGLGLEGEFLISSGLCGRLGLLSGGWAWGAVLVEWERRGLCQDMLVTMGLESTP